MYTPHGTPTALSATHHVGALIGGKYRVRRMLGHGGMGYVYKAENVAIGRTVAVKVLHSHLADDGVTIARFQREARAAASIGHKNIVDILDMGVEPSGAAYLVMEYVRGKSLSTVIKLEGPLGIARAAYIAGQVLDALEQVHKGGIVHRDLKPENILLTTRDGRADFVKLLDFGIATFVEGTQAAMLASDLTPSGRTMGTPHYASPEQLRGSNGRDPTVDVYAMGVSLYEMITGHRPFESHDFAELCHRIQSEVPAPMRAFREDVPTELEGVIAKALAKQASERFVSAAALHDALVPFGAQSRFDEDPDPTDTFTIDLRELSARERKILRPAEAKMPRIDSRPPIFGVSGVFASALRDFVRARLSAADLAQLLAFVPAEVHARFVGTITPDSMCSNGFFDVVELLDTRFGRGERRLVADAGRDVARRDAAALAAETPELFFARLPSIWSRYFVSGEATVAKVGHGYGLLRVGAQDDPRLARSVAFVGLVEEGLRKAGARDVEARLGKAIALGDPADVFECTWAS